MVDRNNKFTIIDMVSEVFADNHDFENANIELKQSLQDMYIKD